MWYPENRHVLNETLNKYLKTGKHKKPLALDKNSKLKKGQNPLHGIIVPHAGYQYSGAVAGTAFSLIKKPVKKAIVIGPSHYVHLFDAMTTNQQDIQTPLGKTKTFNTDFLTGNIEQEHSISNQYPFLQKLHVEQIMPLMIGKITNQQALEIAKKISKIKALYVFSTDLSHFLDYETAVKKDKESVKIIENLDSEKFRFIDACGYFPLLILKELCKIKKTKPELVEYKNSGDVIGDKTSVVGYASFYF
ncbi:AmmeMemoRadiSam system protein B [Candidatus Pacearchaeota archaeon]|nr:AmmeMemoRadiSam system protein B [Candidatus Pacearchaeota archaeon]MBD3282854.1 AmmeMemoRadiSam system protein B [Candidatus Pacearchaeota archaeon]